MRRLIFKSLVHGPLTESSAGNEDDAALAELGAQVDSACPAAAWDESLSIREVDAGSCNGCELEIHALSNVLYDLERFGLRFVASPRHADVLEGVIRGNVDSLMKLIAALEAAGVELIGEGAISDKGGRGVRLKAR